MPASRRFALLVSASVSLASAGALAAPPAPAPAPAAPVTVQPAAPAANAPASTAPASNTPASNTPAPATTATGASGPTSAAERRAGAALDARITTLHRQLAITDAQEPSWRAFTDVMRANLADMNSRMSQRQTAFGSLNAVDDLRSYADIEAARAAGINRLVGPFTTLYAELSPSQKATADRLFHQQTERHARHAGG